jgi:hypothetical protein
MRARLLSYAQLLPVPRAGTRVAAPCAQMRARLPRGGIGAGQLESLGAAVGVPAAPGSVDVTATPGLCPSCPQMRARLSGARGIGTGRDAILRADGECARVCSGARGRQSGCRSARGPQSCRLPASGFRQPPLVANARASARCARNRYRSGCDSARGWRMRARLSGVGGGWLSVCRAARGAAGVRAGIRVRPGSSRMRARLPGARGIGTGWGAIVRADGE